MSVSKVLVPPVRTAPFGAETLGHSAGAAFNAARRLIEGMAAHRAAAAAKRREARDRAALIALARSYQGSQPSFAKDLYAAAMRDVD